MYDTVYITRGERERKKKSRKRGNGKWSEDIGCGNEDEGGWKRSDGKEDGCS